ncbi:surfeit locus protein 5 subunit 22 of Mediator complex, partial [Fagus crenata]
YARHSILERTIALSKCPSQALTSEARVVAELEATSIFTSEPYKVRGSIPDPKQQQPPQRRRSSL